MNNRSFARTRNVCARRIGIYTDLDVVNAVIGFRPSCSRFAHPLPAVYRVNGKRVRECLNVFARRNETKDQRLRERQFSNGYRTPLKSTLDANFGASRRHTVVVYSETYVHPTAVGFFTSLQAKTIKRRTSFTRVKQITRYKINTFNFSRNYNVTVVPTTCPKM